MTMTGDGDLKAPADEDNFAAERAEIARQRAELDARRRELEQADPEDANLTEEETAQAEAMYRRYTGETDIPPMSNRELRSWAKPPNDLEQIGLAEVATPGHDAASAADAETNGLAAMAEAIKNTPQTPESWPHQLLDFHGERLEVRKPSQSALTAMTLLGGIGDLDTQFTLDILGTFFAKHLSPSTQRRVLTLMVDPDADFSYQDLIKAMNAL